MSRCPDCGGALRDAGARWCPRCGAHLAAVTSSAAGTARGGAADAATSGALEPARRLLAAAIVLLAAVLVGSALLEGGDADRGAADDTAAAGVELPDRASSGSGAPSGPAASEDDPAPAGRTSGAACAEVAGCLAWRTVLPDAAPPPVPALARAGNLVIVGGSEGVVGVDTTTGAVRWSRPWPGPPDAARTFVATGDLLVLAGRGLSLYHAPTGLVIGHLPVPGIRDLTDAAAFGDRVLVTLVSEVEGRERSSVMALGRGDGGPRWWEVADEVALTTAGPVVLRDGELAGLDPHDGSPRWRVPDRPAGASGLLGVAEAVAYRQGPSTDALLAFRSADTGQIPEPWSGRTRFRTSPGDVGRPALADSVLQSVIGGVLRWSVPAGDDPCCGATHRASPLLVTPVAAPGAAWRVRDRRGGSAVTWVPETPDAGAPGRVVLGDFTVEAAGIDRTRRADLRVRDVRSGVSVAGGSGLLPVAVLEGGDLLLAGDGRIVRLAVPRPGAE